MPEGVGDGGEGDGGVLRGRDGVEVIVVEYFTEGGAGDGGGAIGETVNGGEDHGLIGIEDKFSYGGDLINFFKGVNDGTAPEGDASGVAGHFGIAEYGIYGHIQIKFNEITCVP